MDREPTEDQLRDAWRALARPEWGEYEQAKRAAAHWALVRLRARVAANGGRVAPPPPAVPPKTPDAGSPPAPWGTLRVSHPGPIFDRKRAAAGERETD